MALKIPPFSSPNQWRTATRLIRDGGWLYHDMLLPLPPPVPTNDKAVIIRLDAIGDYMLFRQALRALRASPLLRGKHITLCGNRVWQDLAEGLDHDCFDTFLPVDRKKIIQSPTYRRLTLRILRAGGFSLALHPTFSRDFIGDSLIRASGAPQRIGFESLPQNISLSLKQLTDQWYTSLVPTGRTYPFELERNWEFLHFLGITAENIPPFQTAFPQNLREGAREAIRRLSDHPIFFLGAQAKHRRWPVERYSALVPHLIRKTGKSVLLTGGHDCCHEAEIIQTQNPGQVINLTGQTNLLELAFLIARARLLISNDSAAVHMGATFMTPTIVIWNAQHAGRFHPYPDGIAPNVHTLYPSSIMLDDAFRARYYHALSPYPVSDITIEQVINVLALLDLQNSEE